MADNAVQRIYPAELRSKLIPVDFQVVLTVILAVVLALFLLSAVNNAPMINSEYSSFIHIPFFCESLYIRSVSTQALVDYVSEKLSIKKSPLYIRPVSLRQNDHQDCSDRRRGANHSIIKQCTSSDFC